MTISTTLLALAIAQTPPSPTSFPRAIIFDAFSPPARAGRTPLEPGSIDAFSAFLRDTAKQGFEERRWRVSTRKSLLPILQKIAPNGCGKVSCFSQVAQQAEASHWIAPLIVAEGNLCKARIVLFDMAQRRVIRRTDRDINPCTADNLLSHAEILGRFIAKGPRAEPPVTVSLTPLSVASLHVPDVPTVAPYRILTTTAAVQREYPLQEAMRTYRIQHMHMFDDPETRNFYVVKNQKFLNECGIRKAADAPIPPEILSFCRGNDWEWAWLGVPTGGLIALGSSSSATEGETVGLVGLSIGAAIAGVSSILAITLNRDAHPPGSGRYYSDRRTLQVLVSEHNQALRREYGLTEAEVMLAGYPP